MRFYEVTAIGQISDKQGWQGYKQYYVKPVELARKNNLALLASYDEKWQSYNFGWFDISGLPKSSKFNKSPITSRSVFPYIKLAANLSLNEKPHGYEVEVIGTETEYRGQGLAPSLYEYALQHIDMPIISDSKQTPAGTALWVKFYNNPKFVVKSIDTESGEVGKAFVEGNKLVSNLDLPENKLRFTLDLR